MGIKTLTDIPFNRIYQAQQLALVRLQLFTVAHVSQLILEVGSAANRALTKSGRDAVVDGLTAYRAKQALNEAWGEFIAKYTTLLDVVTTEAASIAIGVMGRMHEEIVTPAVVALEEAQEPSPDGNLGSILNQIIGRAREQQLSGRAFSDRIWVLNHEGKAGIDRVVDLGLANGISAWETAANLEQYLGAGKNCPEWALTRLYSLSKSEIARGNPTGLVTGNDCAGQGVAYNALRLARTEISRHFAIATDELMTLTPWVEEEQCNLSSAHTGRDECDLVVEGGRDGKGIYPVGTIHYPLHPHCMCYKTHVLMDNDDFVNKLSGWKSGDSWPAMDTYQQMLGSGGLLTDFTKSLIASALVRWVTADEELGALLAI